MKNKKICVLGSLNIDLTVSMERFHQPGETVTGLGFNTFTGGKGGNKWQKTKTELIMQRSRTS